MADGRSARALVIDTSSVAVTAAVVDIPATGDSLPTVLAERVTVHPRGHGELLAPSIQACLGESGTPAAQLTAVIAGLGPGPFTGLRVGLVTAAVLAETLAIPSYGVCSLDAIGAACAEDAEVLVATEALRNEVYWARYRHGRRCAGPAVDRPAQVSTDGVTALAGANGALFDTGAGARDVLYPPPQWLAALAAGLVRTAAIAEPLQPIYLRRPDATVPGASKQVSQ